MGCLFEGKKSITFTKAFQKALSESGCKPKKKLVNKRSEVTIKSRYKDNGIDLYSAYNEVESAVAEGFIITLKNICK